RRPTENILAAVARCTRIAGPADAHSSAARMQGLSWAAALVRLSQEKRGEGAPEDLSGNLIVQLGAATEALNRSWYERNTGRRISGVQRHVKHSAIPWMAATLDGIVEGTDAVFEAKFMLPWSFSEESIWPSSSTTCGSHI